MKDTIRTEDVINATLDVRNTLNLALSHAFNTGDEVAEELLLEAMRRIDDLWTLCDFQHGHDYIINSASREVLGEPLTGVHYERRGQKGETK